MDRNIDAGRVAARKSHKLAKAFLAISLLAASSACSRSAEADPAAVVQVSATERRLAELSLRAQPGVLGVYVEDLATGWSAGVEADAPRPMMSVFKAPMAAAILAKVDAGALSLDRKVTIRKEDLRGGPTVVADQFKGEPLTFTVRELLGYAVSQSDNTATDALLPLIGGPPAVTAFIRGKGVEGFRLDRDEGALGADIRRLGAEGFMADPRDTMTPRAAGAFLRRLAAGELLSPASTELLLDLMRKTTTGPQRIRVGMPAGSELAHKTGGSGMVGKVAIATNDIGLVTTPDGRRLAVAVFLSGSPASDEDRDALIAEAARIATGG